MLARILRPAPAADESARAQATTWGDWPGESSGEQTWSGIRVDPNASLQLLTVYGCVRLIADSISTLPVDVFEVLPGAAPREVPAPGWLSAPTLDLTFTEWCTQVLSSLLLHGNAYLLVLRSTGAVVVEAIPLDPTRVRVVRQRGRLVYLIDGRPADGELMHIKGLMMPGSDVGLSPVEYARQSIGLGLAATEYGAKFFDGEGNMPGVIEIPKVAQPEQMRKLAEAWRRRRSRANGRGLPGVLDDGAQWKPTGVTNEQAQFLATRKFTAAEIAGQMFLIDPSDLGIPVEGSNLTYGNLEQRNLRRVQVTYLPWLVRIETAITSLLGGVQRMRFNVDGLLRADTLTRYQAHVLGITNGFLTEDEARALENLPPLDAADKKRQRQWQLVGLPTLVDSGLMTPNEARLQLGLPPTPGGDVLRDPLALEAGPAQAEPDADNTPPEPDGDNTSPDDTPNA